MLEKQLIKLGSTNPELRQHLRPILVSVKWMFLKNMGRDLEVTLKGTLEDLQMSEYRWGQTSDLRRALQKLPPNNLHELEAHFKEGKLNTDTLLGEAKETLVWLKGLAKVSAPILYTEDGEADPDGDFESNLYRLASDYASALDKAIKAVEKKQAERTNPHLVIAALRGFGKFLGMEDMGGFWVIEFEPRNREREDSYWDTEEGKEWYYTNYSQPLIRKAEQALRQFKGVTVTVDEKGFLNALIKKG